MAPLSTSKEIALAPQVLGPLPTSPLMTVLVTNYNYEKYLGAALDSVLAQTYERFELIVCDDGSTDGSRDLVRRYQQTDSRVALVCRQNGGMAAGLNAAYQLAHGDIICLLDADDTYEPGKLQAIVDHFHERQNAGLCVHPVLPINAEGSPLAAPIPHAARLKEGWQAPLALRQGGYIPLPPCSGLSFRRAISDELFPIPEQFRRGADGYLMRTALWRTEVAVIPVVLAQYRLHANNLTGSLTVNAAKLERAIEDEHLLIDAQKRFLATNVSQKVADRLDVGDHPYYWEVKLALALVSPNDPNLIDGHSVFEIVNRLPNGPRSTAWRVLFALPRRVALMLLRFWWGNSFAKRIFQKFTIRILARV